MSRSYHCPRKLTYSQETGLAVVFLLHIETIIDESETGASATSVFRLQTVNCNALFLSFKDLGQLALDSILGDATLFGVDELNLLKVTRLAYFVR